MVDVWKSDGSNVYQNAMIWAESLTVVLNGPLANSSGVVYMGYFPIGSLLNTDSESQFNFTLSQLINNAEY
jgi:hypothetical protein